MAWQDDVGPGLRYHVSFTDVFLPKVLVEIVDRPSIVVVGKPVFAVRVVPGAIVRIPVIPITVGESPSPINGHLLSCSGLREKSRTTDRPNRQAQNKRH